VVWEGRSRKAAPYPDFVGWVERSDTHLCSVGVAMGIAALHPSYETERDFAFSRHHLPEALQSALPTENQRAQGRPGARRTRGLARNG